ncbi:hypothetical protein DPMN_124876 [Dreissena polymorpha]|uniref:Uncharacterized protein n=1 Tax=Dreissena polymorpha TaxID=45954 RepID=A0A9D4GWG0_DREPO|nr:hypothetical protein DPMN_124876 [Dreissena polymorpha]
MAPSLLSGGRGEASRGRPGCVAGVLGLLHGLLPATSFGLCHLELVLRWQRR